MATAALSSSCTAQPTPRSPFNAQPERFALFEPEAINLLRDLSRSGNVQAVQVALPFLHALSAAGRPNRMNWMVATLSALQADTRMGKTSLVHGLNGLLGVPPGERWEPGIDYDNAVLVRHWSNPSVYHFVGFRCGAQHRPDPSDRAVLHLTKFLSVPTGELVSGLMLPRRGRKAVPA